MCQPPRVRAAAGQGAAQDGTMRLRSRSRKLPGASSEAGGFATVSDAPVVTQDGRCSLRGHLPRRASSSRTVITNASDRSISSCEWPSARRRRSISASVIPRYQSSRYKGNSHMTSIVDQRVATSASAEPNCIRLLNLSVSLLRQRKPSIVNWSCGVLEPSAGEYPHDRDAHFDDHQHQGADDDLLSHKERIHRMHLAR